MARSLEGWPTKAKEAPSPHEVRLALLDTSPVLQCLGENITPKSLTFFSIIIIIIIIVVINIITITITLDFFYK